MQISGNVVPLIWCDNIEQFSTDDVVMILSVLIYICEYYVVFYITLPLLFMIIAVL
jgi:hypothetical protein